MSRDVVYLALDPGDTTGWAQFGEDGGLIAYGQVKESEYNKWLNEQLTAGTIKIVICEDYRNHGWVQQKRWSQNKTSKKIGGLEALANVYGIRVVLQPNTVKSIGYMWGGIEKPSNHSISHQFDAYAHGVYFLQQEGIRKPGQGLRVV